MVSVSDLSRLLQYQGFHSCDPTLGLSLQDFVHLSYRGSNQALSPRGLLCLLDGLCKNVAVRSTESFSREIKSNLSLNLGSLMSE